MNDLKELWDSALTQIELNVSKASFNTWFKKTSVVKSESGVIYVGVPNHFVKTWLVDKHHKFILKILRDLNEHVRSIEYIVVQGKEQEVKHHAPEYHVVNAELPLKDLYINKEDNLNPRYTFDSFVVGPFNELAYAASQSIIKNPGLSYNPLFIYGNTGHGKTHLIQAIGNQIQKDYSKLKVFYVTSEKFVIDYVNSIQENKTNLFKEKYRKYDVLIMDDIQFLSKKDKTQEELFHLFDNLYENNKQIIFSSDKHPNYLPNVEERLKSRFSAGMIVDIPSPDHESRIAIIKKKMLLQNFWISDETIDFLAVSLEGNVRELEGILNNMICQSRLKNKELSLNEVKNLIKDNARPRKIASVKEVVKSVADFYNIEEEIIYKKTRRKEAVKPRQVIMFILREDFHISYPTIGQKIGGRDHTTVIHSCDKVKNDLKTDSILSQEIHQIRSMIR